jgi:hypothetical protein
MPIKPRLLLCSATTANSSAMSGKTASNLPAVCSAGRPPTQGVPWQGKFCFYTSTLQVQFDGKRESPSRQLSGCRHAKEEMQYRKSQRTPKTTMRMVFSSNLTTTGVSFEAALRSRTEQQQLPPTRQVPVPGSAAAEKRVSRLLCSIKKQVSQLRSKYKQSITRQHRQIYCIHRSTQQFIKSNFEDFLTCSISKQ